MKKDLKKLHEILSSRIYNLSELERICKFKNNTLGMWVRLNKKMSINDENTFITHFLNLTNFDIFTPISSPKQKKFHFQLTEIEIEEHSIVDMDKLRILLKSNLFNLSKLERVCELRIRYIQRFTKENEVVIPQENLNKENSINFSHKSNNISIFVKSFTHM